MTHPGTTRTTRTLRLAAASSLATLAAWTAPTALAQALTPAQVFAQASPSVWRIQTFDAAGLLLGQGSGVVVAEQRVVTNCHVLARAYRVQVRREMRDAPLEAGLAQWDPERDLCLLSVAALRAPAVRAVALADIGIGQAAYAIGHPVNLDLTMSSGLVSSLRRNDAGQVFLVQTSAAISGGSSGGGLFNERGQLLGLTTIGSSAGSVQNLNFAIPAAWIADLPRRHAARQAKLAAEAAAASGVRR
jgi:serine protease Do